MIPISISTSGLTSGFNGVSTLNIGNYIAALKQTGQPADLATALALDSLQKSLAGLQKAISGATLTANIPAVPSALISGSQVEFTLTASTTLITTTAPVTTGSRLIIILTEDSTGGRIITWDVMFKDVTVEIDTRPSAVNIFEFFSRTDPSDSTLKWFGLSLPLLAQS